MQVYNASSVVTTSLALFHIIIQKKQKQTAAKNNNIGSGACRAENVLLKLFHPLVRNMRIEKYKQTFIKCAEESQKSPENRTST